MLMRMPARAPSTRDHGGAWAGRLAGLGAALLPAAATALVAGPAAAVAAFAATGLLLQAARFALPAWAHDAFVRGALPAARRRYRLLAHTSWLGARKRCAELSLAAVELAAGHHQAAQRALDALDGDELAGDARAAWLNNRAYARLRLRQDLDEAVALARAAVELRPDVPAIRHTHGLALLAQGKVDAAIAALDEVRKLAELPAALEAERCDDLADAWTQKGEAAYAAEYRQRAAQARRANAG